MSESVELDQFFCSLCSLSLRNDNDAKLHYVGKKHRKCREAEWRRRDAESKSVFLFGFPANSLTKEDICSYFLENFGPVQNVRYKEAKFSSVILEFFDAKIAADVIATKKHKIKDRGTVAKATVIESKPKDKKEQSSVAEGTMPPKRRDKNGAKLANDRSPVVAETSSCSSGSRSSDCENFESVDQLINLHKRCALDADEYERRLSVANDIGNTLQTFVACPLSVQLYGSSRNGFGWKDSDLDLTLLISKESDGNDHGADDFRANRPSDFLLKIDPDLLRSENRCTYEELRQFTAMERIGFLKKCLSTNERVKKVSEIPGNRCPLLKMVHFDRRQYKCELTFDNALALNNTEWLKLLATKCAVLPIFVSILKYWSVKLDLTSASHYTFNGYTLALMAVTFLQTKKRLPAVAAPGDANNEKYVDKNANFSDGWNRFPNEEMDHPTAFIDPPPVAVDLLGEFFDFMSKQNLRCVVFVPRHGVVVSVETFFEKYCHGEDRSFVFAELNVQDPFVPNHNVAAKINARLVEKFQRGSGLVARSCQRNGRSFPEAFSTSLCQKNLVEVEQNFQSFVANGVSTYSLTVNPTVQDINKFLTIWRGNFRSIWWEQTRNAVRFVLCQLLSIELAAGGKGDDDGESPPSEKRRKFNDEENSVEKFACLARCSVWLGRKKYQPTKNDAGDDVVAKDGRDYLRAEAEITRKVAEELRSGDRLAKPLAFNLALEWSLERVPRVALTFECCDGDQFGHFTTFCTFFRSFFHKTLPACYR